MTTIRQFIRRKEEYLLEKDHQTARMNKHKHIRSIHHPKQTTATTNRTSQLPPPSQQAFPLQRGSLLLPSIHELSPKSHPFRLQTKRSEDISRYFHLKHQAVIPKQRFKTEGSRERTSSKERTNSKERISVLSRKERINFTVSFKELPLRPLDQYCFQMQNIRLAERLLVTKASPEVCRKSQKKFFKEQKQYRERRSRNSSILLKSASGRKIKQEHPWVN